ncbi:GNAT family N-acetyltransferase [Rhizobium sp. YIM 134829]|uniref:GNAT family N-acetyltransferase n=1 Tax=Rhizobium sp. YIM 134829 TaxID=3390453 RepID=UPI00397989D7
MRTTNPMLPPGYSAVPPGMIATVVTCLEMRARPVLSGSPLPAGLRLTRAFDPALSEYRALFRRIGEDWLWTSRLEMSDAALGAILTDPKVELFVLSNDRGPIGMLELDFRVDGEGEIAFFGLVGDAVGAGAGRLMMDQALAIAWSRPIRRLWVHTCHFDHPRALGFYQRAGFVPYATLIDVIRDPRLTGLLPDHVAPHVPPMPPSDGPGSP